MNRFALAALLCSIMLGCVQKQSVSPTKGTLRMMTTESLAPLIQREAEEFHRLYPEASVTVLPTSTRDAIVQMFNDSVQLVIIDRELNAEERQIAQRENLDVVENRIAKDALALIVHKDNPVEKVTYETAAKVLAKKLTDWKQLPESRMRGSINLALTGRNSGAYELLMSQFFAMTEQIVPDYRSETQQGVLDYVVTHPQALGVVSLAALDTTGQPSLQTKKASIRLLAIGGRDSATANTFVKLHQANVYREAYPLSYSIHLYTTAASTSVAAGFSAFIASVPGQKIFLNAGLVPATMPVRVVQLTQEQIPQ